MEKALRASGLATNKDILISIKGNLSIESGIIPNAHQPLCLPTISSSN